MFSYTGALYKYRLFASKLKSTNFLPQAGIEIKKWGGDEDTEVLIKLDL